eukprot:TRINITY_DN9916_c0_g1_i21.p2 TRINITY_DN9916_c0_g1~~TRINITY_DN9916_c0_g1_i21.p2  ORF type:complete len:103 (+),score=15.74 TRINITY_DN9916_c0_g1_i21:845-1153(+)
MSSSVFFLTIIFGVLGVFSFFQGNQGQAHSSPSENPNYRPKFFLEFIEDWMYLLWRLVLNPYFLLVIYMLWIILIFIRRERNWTTGRFRRLMGYIKTHSKCS